MCQFFAYCGLYGPEAVNLIANVQENEVEAAILVQPLLLRTR